MKWKQTKGFHPFLYILSCHSIRFFAGLSVSEIYMFNYLKTSAQQTCVPPEKLQLLKESQLEPSYNSASILKDLNDKNDILNLHYRGEQKMHTYYDKMYS